MRTLHALLLLCSSAPMALAQAPYCAAHTVNGPDDGDYVARVLLGSVPAIDLTTTFTSGQDYQDYTLAGDGSVTRLVPGNMYFLTIKAGTFVGDDYAAWIDFDDNGTFEPDEVIADQFNTSAGQSLLFSFTVPADARVGYRRLRVRCCFNMPTPDPCGTFDYGETEDYTVVIDDGSPCIPLFSRGNTEGDAITQVYIDGVDFTIAGDETGYTDYRLFGGTIEVGGGSMLQVVTGAYDDDIVSVWVDWNNDGDWTDPLEDLGFANTTTPNELVSFALNPPNTILFPERVTLRIRVSFELNDPCADETYGDVKDFTLAIRREGLPCLTAYTAAYEYDGYALARIGYDLFADEDATDQWPFYTYATYGPFGTTFEQGDLLPHPLELTTRATNTGVWVLLDVNMDDDFDDAGELLASVVSTVVDQDHSVDLTIPVTCPPGLHHFRIHSFNNGAPPTSSCEPYIWGGETYDTELIVTEAGGPCLPFTLTWTVGNDAIDGVHLNTLDNTGTGAAFGPYYSDYRALSTELTTGSTYTLDIDPTNANVTQFAAYIDYNDNGDLDDPGENIANVIAPGYDYHPSFTVPGGVGVGPRLFRVRALKSTESLPIGACASSVSGEVEDYTVIINSGTAIGEATGAGLCVHTFPHAVVLTAFDASWSGAQVLVLDATGRSVRTGRIAGSRTVLDPDGLATGTYTVLVQGANGAWSGRFVHPGQ